MWANTRGERDNTGNLCKYAVNSDDADGIQGLGVILTNGLSRRYPTQRPFRPFNLGREPVDVACLGVQGGLLLAPCIDPFRT